MYVRTLQYSSQIITACLSKVNIKHFNIRFINSCVDGSQITCSTLCKKNKDARYSRCKVSPRVNYVTEGGDGMKKDGKVKGEHKEGLGSPRMNHHLAVFPPSRRLAGEPT
jgi:hypothetical protein